MSLNSLADHTVGLFAKCFGRAPRMLAAAPGRVNLIGEHTDYNDGFVLPMAIDRCTLVAGDRAAKREVTVHSVTTGDTAVFPTRPSVERGEPAWSNYVRGVVAGFQGLGARFAGLDLVIDSEVPFGGGLASSAALEVATATVIEALADKPLEPLQKALLCQAAEHRFAGVPCGLMDQFTSVFATEDHALLLDCRTREVKPVPMTDPGVTVLIINTNVRHKLADGEYAKRRAECEEAARGLGVPALRDARMEDLVAVRRKLPATVFRRARHVISENQRTLDMARAAAAGQWEAAGDLMYASHASLRDDYEVSCPELDAVVEIAHGLGQAGGVYGCRMTGGGFGGCAVALVKTHALRAVGRKVEELYEQKTRGHAAIFSSRPSAGARTMKPA